MSDVMTNDTNTAKAPSYTVVGLNTGYKLNYGKWEWTSLVASITCLIKSTSVQRLLTLATIAITNPPWP